MPSTTLFVKENVIWEAVWSEHNGGNANLNLSKPVIIKQFFGDPRLFRSGATVVLQARRLNRKHLRGTQNYSGAS